MLEFMETQTLIGTEAAARLARVDRSTITRWVQSGRLTPAFKLPGKQGYYLFEPEHVTDVAGAA